jgi:hypothetical protein
VTLRQALAHLPAVPIDRAAAAAVRQGQAWPLAHLPAALDRDAMLLDPAGEVVAVAVRRGRAWAYGRVLGAA